MHIHALCITEDKENGAGGIDYSLGVRVQERMLSYAECENSDSGVRGRKVFTRRRRRSSRGPT